MYLFCHLVYHSTVQINESFFLFNFFSRMLFSTVLTVCSFFYVYFGVFFYTRFLFLCSRLLAFVEIIPYAFTFLVSVFLMFPIGFSQPPWAFCSFFLCSICLTFTFTKSSTFVFLSPWRFLPRSRSSIPMLVFYLVRFLYLRFCFSVACLRFYFSYFTLPLPLPLSLNFPNLFLSVASNNVKDYIKFNQIHHSSYLLAFIEFDEKE